jgi:hypothetical protein
MQKRGIRAVSKKVTDGAGGNKENDLKLSGVLDLPHPEIGGPPPPGGDPILHIKREKVKKEKKVARGGKTREEVIAERAAAEARKYPVSEANGFESKHLYEDGALGEDGSRKIAFDEFMGDIDGAKKYILNLDRRLYNADILPGFRSTDDAKNAQRMTKWMNEAPERKVSIVDEDLALVTSDIAAVKARTVSTH